MGSKPHYSLGIYQKLEKPLQQCNGFFVCLDIVDAQLAGVLGEAQKWLIAVGV